MEKETFIELATRFLESRGCIVGDYFEEYNGIPTRHLMFTFPKKPILGQPYPSDWFVHATDLGLNLGLDQIFVYFKN
jgi:hypothetical protein